MFKDWGDCVWDPNINKVATLSCLPIIFLNVLNALLLFSGVTTLIMFILGSYRFMSSSGDPKKIAAAQNNFKFGIIGMAVVLMSFLIINIISIATNTPCILKFGFGC